jgi:hypothetical protein
MKEEVADPIAVVAVGLAAVDAIVKAEAETEADAVDLDVEVIVIIAVAEASAENNAHVAVVNIAEANSVAIDSHARLNKQRKVDVRKKHVIQEVRVIAIVIRDDIEIQKDKVSRDIVAINKVGAMVNPDAQRVAVRVNRSREAKEDQRRDAPKMADGKQTIADAVRIKDLVALRRNHRLQHQRTKASALR